MNTDQIMSLARGVLLAAGSFAVTHGYVTSSGLEQTVGSVLALASVVWSQWHHKAP